MSALLTLLQNSAAYGFLIYAVVAKDMSISSFVFYFGIITGFSGWLSGLLNGCADALQCSRSFCDLRLYLQLPERGETGTKPAPEGTWRVEFEGVYYKYPQSDAQKEAGEDNPYVLRDINLTLDKGEKTALVGLNGAGKTTLVKLLSGLLEPTRGRILIDGVDLKEINKDEYFKALSVVFQDIYLLPVSIRQNITLCEDSECDAERLTYAISESGLTEKIAQLSGGVDTLLVKSVREGAVDLSGGEKQKLALARALYKGGRMMILDEPTSALDPLAEGRMYEEFSFSAVFLRLSIFIWSLLF